MALVTGRPATKKTGPVDVVYRLHHLRIRVVSPDGPHLRHVDTALVYKAARRDGGGRAGSADDVTVRFVPPDEAPAAPPDAAPVAVHEHGLTVSRSAAGYHVHAPWVAALVRPEGEGAEVALLGSLPHDAGRAVFYLLVVVLYVLLRWRGLHGLHAAALVHPGSGPSGSSADDRAGVLLTAPSGSGKSTTALTLVRRGWGYVSDDSVLLRARPDGVAEALSFRRDFCVRPDAAERHPELGGHAWPRSPSDPLKWRVDVSRVYGAPFVEGCVPRLLLVPELTGGAESRLAPLDVREALRLLLEHGSVQLTPDAAAEQIALSLRLARQAPAFRLLAGRDALEAPDRVEALVREALARAS